MEVLEEEEQRSIQGHVDQFTQQRNVELADVQRLAQRDQVQSR